MVDFLAQAKRKGASGATIARRLSAIRSFFLYLEEDGRIANSPVQEALGHSSLQTTSRYVSLARELMDEQLEANAL